MIDQAHDRDTFAPVGRVGGHLVLLRRTNPIGLTALSHGNIVRLHATVRQGTIGREKSRKNMRLAGPYNAVTALPQPTCKK
jgi:hypothetical protein